MPLKYLINTESDWQLLLNYINEVDIFAYDTETNGSFSQFDVALVGISFGFDDFAAYVPLSHLEGAQLDIRRVIRDIKPIFESASSRYVAHNAKYDEMVLSVYGIDCRGSGDDTLVMAWLLNEGRESKGLKSLAQRYLGVHMETYEDVISKQPKRRGVARDYDFGKVRLDDALSYAADDAFYTLELYHLFKDSLEKQKLLSAYERIERPLTRTVRHLEQHGVAIDIELINQAAKDLPLLAEQIESEIYEQAEEVFNINSSRELGRILFSKLQIGTNVPRTPTGNYATDKKTLQLYADHDIVNNILRRKKIQKTNSTFVEGLMEHIAPDDRIHPQFNPCGTVTGRFTSRTPNLQQIENDEVESIKVRNFFIPPKERVFVVSDYSQIELRILAHLSGDTNMIDAFLSGKDFHEQTARLMLNIQGKGLAPSEPVPSRQRFNAKALNFGIPYGRGPQSVAEQLGVKPVCGHWPRLINGKWHRDEMPPCHNCGKCFITDWFAGFPQVQKFKEKTLAEAKARGYIRTLAGRKRRLLPDIRSDNSALRSSAERQAFNSRIQGSAADVIKLAMVALEEPLKDFGAAMIIQIHDELVVESPEDVCDDVSKVMKDVMEKPLDGKNPLRLPLVTEPNIVERWGDAK